MYMGHDSEEKEPIQIEDMLTKTGKQFKCRTTGHDYGRFRDGTGVRIKGSQFRGWRK